MLGTLNKRRKARLYPDEVIDRIEAELEALRYVAPEYIEARRAGAVSTCRRFIREYRA